MIPVRASIHSIRPPFVTVSLIGLSIFGFLHETGFDPETLNDYIFENGVVPLRQLWALGNDPLALEMWLYPLFTSMFLHGSWLHLLGNALYLWVFGDAVEGLMGRMRFLLFYLACGVAASQAQVLMNPSSQLPMIGASGAIAGVLGAYLLLYPRSRIVVMFPIFIYPVFFSIPAFLFLFVWFAQNVAAGSFASLSQLASEAGGVAWWAHAGGFVAGALLVKPFMRTQDPHDFGDGPLLIDETFSYR